METLLTLAESVPCPTCGAEKGRACRTKANPYCSTATHPRRLLAAERARIRRELLNQILPTSGFLEVLDRICPEEK